MKSYTFYKSFLLVFFCAALTLPVQAFDWGGFLSNNTGMTGNLHNAYFNQSNKLTLWMRVPLPETANSYFTAETYYAYDYSGKNKEFSHVWDLNLFKLSVAHEEGPAKLTFNLGRFGIRDLSGLILSQTADGMELNIAGKAFSAKTYIGFTGLLNNKTTNMAAANPEHKNLHVYQASPAILIGNIFFSFPRLFAQQTLSCELYAMTGIRNPTFFLTAALNGPIKGPLFYIASTSWALTKSKFSNISSFELTAFIPVRSSMVSWRNIFATGSAGRYIGDFTPFTLISANMDSSIKYAGYIKSGIVGSIRPIQPIVVTAGVDAFFNVMNKNKAKGFSGMQWQTALRWQIMSDFQVSCAAGQFFDWEKRRGLPYTFANIKVLYSF
ncbi:hypothetical protein H0R92_05310 [Treponema sp. OMZ 840]|uniref:hypothetical protein n=1 Tax=Treponema sp. OMZ 840 TaxID=244313 RepID=UPI003D94468E